MRPNGSWLRPSAWDGCWRTRDSWSCGGGSGGSWAIASGFGEARNAIVARTSDAVVAVGGEFGTLSEIALALKMGKPVVGLGTWELGRDDLAHDPIVRTEAPEEAVDQLRRVLPQMTSGAG